MIFGKMLLLVVGLSVFVVEIPCGGCSQVFSDGFRAFRTVS